MVGATRRSGPPTQSVGGGPGPSARAARPSGGAPRHGAGGERGGPRPGDRPGPGPRIDNRCWPGPGRGSSAARSWRRRSARRRRSPRGDRSGGAVRSGQRPAVRPGRLVRRPPQALSGASSADGRPAPAAPQRRGAREVTRISPNRMHVSGGWVCPRNSGNPLERPEGTRTRANSGASQSTNRAVRRRQHADFRRDWALRSR